MDLNRVVDFLADLGYGGNGKKLVLLGFSDATGDPHSNLALSQDRAQTVAAEFRRRGLDPGTIKGFGAALPVASNESDEGREKNRRVEIWLKE
jgi:phosphate transport system substrate-binding protein